MTVWQIARDADPHELVYWRAALVHRHFDRLVRGGWTVVGVLPPLFRPRGTPVVGWGVPGVTHPECSLTWCDEVHRLGVTPHGYVGGYCSEDHT